MACCSCCISLSARPRNLCCLSSPNHRSSPHQPMENPASLSLSCISCRFTVKHRDVDLKMPSWYFHTFAARCYHMLVDVDTDWECQGLSVIWHWHFPENSRCFVATRPLYSKRNHFETQQTSSRDPFCCTENR